MKIALANDHRGYTAKEQIRAIVTEHGHECIDFGTSDDNPVDYPDMAFQASTAVATKRAERAILICGTGIGMSITANKVKGIRAALCYDELNAHISRHHNDANVLCLAGDLLGAVALCKIVEVWLNTEFVGGRHQRRINKISAIEQGRDPREVTSTEPLR